MPSIALTALTETRIAQGTKASLDIHVTRGGMAGPVTIAVAGLAGGVSAAPLVLAEGVQDGKLDIDVLASATQGPVVATLNATAGALSSTTPLPLFVKGMPGALDTTFGTAGTLLINNWSPNALAVTSTGAVVLTGKTTAQVDAIALRVTPAGAVDATYGSGGYAAGACTDPNEFGMKLGFGAPQTIALLKSDQILIGGDSWVVRFDATGKIDSTFGNTAGCHGTKLSFEPDAYPNGIWALAQRADGDIFVGYDGVQRGTPPPPPLRFLGSTRLTPAGTVRPSNAGVSYGLLSPSVSTAGLGMAVRTDPASGAFNGFFAMGTAANAYGIIQESEIGLYDQGFTGHGQVSVPATAVVETTHTSMVATADGSAISVIPTAPGGVQKFLIAGFTKTGAVLPTLGTNGVAGPFDGAGRWIVADAKGRYLVVVTQDDKEEIRRFNANGALDTTFGTGGAVTFTHPGALGDASTRAAIAPDGRIVLLGQLQGGTSPTSLTRIWD